MPVCKPIRGQKRDVCIGDMDRLITLKSRDITPATDDDAPYFTETFGTDVNCQVWAMRKSIDGVTVFDRTNIERVITDDYYIRYNSDVTAEVWIEDGGIRFDIWRVDNLDGRNEFMRLRCSHRGVTSNYNNDV